MRRPLLRIFACVCVCASTLAAGAARAGVILDQSADPTGNRLIYSDVRLGVLEYAQEAQGFRVGIDGRLTSAELLLNGFGDGNLELQLRRTSPSGLPSTNPADVLAVADVPSTYIPFLQPKYVDFSFGPNAPLVKSGDLLSLVLVQTIPGGGITDWVGTDANIYGAGQASTLSHVFYHDVWSSPIGFGGQLDLGFKTFVQPVPEPSGLLISGFLAGAFAVCRRVSGGRRLRTGLDSR